MGGGKTPVDVFPATILELTLNYMREEPYTCQDRLQCTVHAQNPWEHYMSTWHMEEFTNCIGAKTGSYVAG